MHKSCLWKHQYWLPFVNITITVLVLIRDGNYIRGLISDKNCQHIRLHLFVLHSLTLLEKYPYLELFWSVFSGICTEYGGIFRISLYSVQMRGNTDTFYAE